MIPESQANNNETKEFVISLMLFLVACMFLASKIIQVTIWYIREYSHKNSLQFQHASVAMQYARLLIILNHSANSLIYIVFFQKFRKAFLGLLCFKPTRLTSGNEQMRTTRSRQETSSTELARPHSSDTPQREQQLWNQSWRQKFVFFFHVILKLHNKRQSAASGFVRLCGTNFLSQFASYSSLLEEHSEEIFRFSSSRSCIFPSQNSTWPRTFDHSCVYLMNIFLKVTPPKTQKILGHVV